MGLDPEYLVGVDGGGTGCRVRLCDRKGREIAASSGGPANINTDFTSTLQNILLAVCKAYEAAGLDPARRADDAAWVGLAGAGVGDLAARMEHALGFAATRVSTDRKTTVEGALGGGDGTVAMVGTGSFFVRRAGGTERSIGGWGYQLGDECGGAWLGRELLRAVLKAEDGILDHSDLTARILHRFSGRPGDIVRFAHSATPGEIGGLAPDVTAAQQAGDPVARAIMDDAVDLLFGQLNALDARNGGPVYLLGGLAPVYAPQLPERYRRLVRAPLGDALDGAVALARQQFRCLEPEGK